MSDINVVIIIMTFIIVHQITATLQLQTTIPCGTKYLKETIGLSLTNNHLYQFLLINDTIKIIKYDYRKLSKNNIDKNNYKLNLIDGQMLTNGLQDLIPSDIAKEFIKEIPLNKTEKSVSDSNELRSFAMSINKQNKIRIVFIKPFNNKEYDILDYNEQKNMNRIDSFTRISKEENNIIMGIISNKNSGIILLFYNKLSYRLNIIFKANKRFDNIDFELAKSLVVDSGLKFLYQLDEEPNEQQQQQELTKSFAQIFGPHTFTYGFVDDNDQINLFSKQNEKLIKFSMDIFVKNNITQKKYPFKLQSFKDFFHCNRPLVPVKIDDNKQTTISTTLTTTVKPPRTKHDSTTTGKQHPSTTTTTTTISTMKTARISIVIDNIDKSNDLKTTTTTIPSPFDELHSKFPIIIIILISMLIFLLLPIVVIICIQKKKKPSRIIESLRLSDGPKQSKFSLNCFKKPPSPQVQFDLDKKSSSLLLTTKTKTITKKSGFPVSLISKSTSMTEKSTNLSTSSSSSLSKSKSESIIADPQSQLENSSISSTSSASVTE